MAQALTLRNDTLRDYSPVLVISVALHLLLLALLTLNLSFMPRRDPQPVRLAIQATVVDAQALRQRALEEERRARQVQEAADRRRREELEQRRAQEQQRQAEQQRQQEERRLAEQKRREQAEAQRRDEARRKQEAEQARQQKLEQERRQAEERRRAEADSKRKAEADRRLAQSRADLARQLAEEERLAEARDSGMLDQYAEIIRQKVERNWIKPASARSGLNCTVLVRQIPGGEVVDVRVAECNGDAAVLRSIEAAVLRSSPLPPPPDPTLFERSLRFEFRPTD